MHRYVFIWRYQKRKKKESLHTYVWSDLGEDRRYRLFGVKIMVREPRGAGRSWAREDVGLRHARKKGG